MRLLIPLLVFMTACPAFAADSPRLRFPVECHLNESCWLMNLPDTDPDTGVFKDYKCGPHSYDGHDGTDIAIRDEGAMKAGVSVIAAQSGTVTRLRNTEPDKFSNLTEQQAIKEARKDCGNGLLIEHDKEWSTQYCHLKKDSFKVKQGDIVKAGQVLAEIGLSGITDHPHLHLTLKHKGVIIDPFTGAALTAGCGKGATKLTRPAWGERVTTENLNLYDGGFAAKTPEFALISQGQKPAEPNFKSQQLTFWFAYFAAKKGDRISLVITSPAGNVLADHQFTQEKNQARHYAYTGKILPQGLPEKGVYKGEARVTRINEKGETRTETLLRTLEIK
jgi:hypothetical protein